MMCRLIAILLLVSACDLFENHSGVPINENIWVNGYLAAWQHNPETFRINSGMMKTSDIDWSAITHLTYFSLEIGPDGNPLLSLDPDDRYTFNTDRIDAIVRAGHEHNTSVLFSVGGGGNYDGFHSAIQDSNRTRFVQTIQDMILLYGFDGVNLNMTPIEESDIENYSTFVLQLGDVFDSIRTIRGERPLLTVAALKADGLFEVYSRLQHRIDQINILTYHMVQPWRAWQAWHHSALYNRSATLNNATPIKFPSTDSKVHEALDAGIRRSKIGIAISFYAMRWDTVNLLETWAAWPSEDNSILSIIPFSQLAQSEDLSASLWDANARVPYLNLIDPKSFISYENERSVRTKIRYAKVKRIGGVMIWELGGGFIASNDPDKRNPLLTAIKNETH